MRSDTSSAQRSSVEAQASKRCACWQATAGLLSRNAMCTQLGANSRAQSRSLRATRGKRRSAHPQPLIITIEYSEFVGARGFVSLAPQLAASRAIRPVSCGFVISTCDGALPRATGNHFAFGKWVVTALFACSRILVAAPILAKDVYPPLELARYLAATQE
jgi:hypothetical protein